MYTVYILYSKSLDRFYTGYTNDLDRRFSEHNRKKGKFTDNGIPWEVVHTEVFAVKKDAMKREAFIKAQKSRSFFSNLLNSR